MEAVLSMDRILLEVDREYGLAERWKLACGERSPVTRGDVTFMKAAAGFGSRAVFGARSLEELDLTLAAMGF